MIYVDRARTDNEGRKIAPDVAWYEKAEEATRSAILDPEIHKFEPQIYGAEIVRAPLEELFCRKCAYCEGPLPESEWDVEHFRPKGRVAENKSHPGYYWLAYNWENLYPSCKNCNQRRRDRPLWGDLTFKTAAGKLDQFPLKDESNRAMKPDEEIAREDNLLLDPCCGDPKRHLDYSLYGEIDGIDEYGNATIRICNLTRRRLRKSRETKISEVIQFLELIRDTKDKGCEQTSEKLRTIMQISYLNNCCCFAGVARFVVDNPERFGI